MKKIKVDSNIFYILYFLDDFMNVNLASVI